MKKYASFPVDCTTLAEEFMAYLNDGQDIESAEYQAQAIHLLAQDDVSALEAAVPSLATTFDGLTVALVAHITVNKNAMLHTSFDGNFILIPLEDCSDVSLNTFTVAPDAVKDGWIYSVEDCTADESVPLDGPLIISSGLTHNLTKASINKLGDVLLVAFTDDISSYLA